ncbi:MAG: response regulator [Actinobacteria bacterium]|nr:MAG: response regulator [Actinomycetota bacterium]
MASPPSTVGTDGPPTVLRGVRVLVVDDNPDVRELIAAVLERAQAEVATAASADEALEAVKRKRPDVLLCDLHMPGIDGFELIHRVRAWERTGGAGAAIPAAAVSAYASLGRRLRHARDEFQAFLTKPVDPETLVRTVRDLAQR